MWIYIGNVEISYNIDVNNCDLIYDSKNRLRIIPNNNYNRSYLDIISFSNFISSNIVTYYLNKNLDEDNKLKFINIKFEGQNKVYINKKLIDKFKNTLIFKDIILLYLKNTKENDIPMIDNLSIVPNIIIDKSNKIFNKNPKSDFNIKLFDYQKKAILRMIEIEDGVHMSFDRNIKIELNDIDVLWDPHYQKVVEDSSICHVTTNGGILADTMGLGKTITTIGLMHYTSMRESKTYDPNDFKDINRIYSRATLIIVPSHLAKQWVDEYEKAHKSHKKIIVILTKTHHDKVSYLDIVQADVVIVTIQFLLNIKFYGTLFYNIRTMSQFNIDTRDKVIFDYYNELIKKPTYLDECNPLFEFFHFNRLIIDEGHEIMETTNNKVGSFIHHFIRSIRSRYKWYISGTPFTTLNGFINTINYLGLSIHINNSAIKINEINGWFQTLCIDINNSLYKDIHTYLLQPSIIEKILTTCTIRHLKDDVKDNINLLGYSEEIEWVELTKSERNIYDSRALSGKTTKIERRILQQLCCHPLIAESFKKIVGSEPTSLEDVQDKLIEHHTKNIQVYTKKIEELDKTNQAFHMLLSNYNTKITESKFILSTLEKINDIIEDDDNNCIICYDMMPEPVITPCGHLFCQECINKCLSIKKECPMCKGDVKVEQLVKVKKSTKQELQETEEIVINPLILKYGTKLGKLIQITRSLLSQNARIIIFSQWDDMLLLIRKSMMENGIDCSFISGNVYRRNKAISRFKLGGKDNSVILLSLEHSASGTNLTEASHIIIVEPIDNTKENIKAIEGQAIGRAVRLGQKNVIKIIRILCKDTIEEEIYNSKYI